MKSKTTRFMSRILAIILIGVAGYGLRASSLQVPSSGTWAPAPGALLEARSGAAAATLPDGRVLITGGEAGGSALASAELFNADGSFSPAAPMSFARSGHTAVALADGRVLVAGGVTLDGGSTNSAELYDPVSDSWSPAGAMLEARSGHTATLLEDGRVLIAGGEHAGAASFSLELFDPVSNTFAPAGTMLAARTGHAAAALPEGKVLLTGGLPAQAGSDGTNPQATTEIYDSASGVVVPGPEMAFARAGHSATALLTGDVLVAGGSNGAEDLASAEVYSAGSGTFFLVSSSLTTPRSGHLAVRLPHNNSVLLAGGTSGGAAVSSAELYRPWSESFVSTGSMGEARAAAASAAAGEGVLLVAGGCSAGDCSAGLSTGGSSALATAELYGFATVKTDKDDYAPGETVTITGSGWEPGETVSLLLHEVDNPDPHEDRTLTAVADEAGFLFNNEFHPEEHDIGVRFYLTASGSRSQAQTTFTDAVVDSAIVFALNSSAGPLSVAAGSTLNWSISATCTTTATTGPNTCAAAGTTIGGPVQNGYSVDIQQDTTSGFSPPASVETRDSGSTTGGAAAGSFTAPSVAGTYFYRARHATQQIGTGPSANTWQAANSNVISVTVEADNTAPTVAADNASVTVDEGQTATNTGTYSDPDGDDVTITASVGVVTKTGTDSGTWSWSFATTDGPDDSQTVTITADDGNGGVTTTTFSLTVDNVAPQVAYSSPPTSADEGQTKTFNFTVNDPGDDTYAVAASFPDCGTGGTLVGGSFSVSGNSGSQTGSFQCNFPDGPATPEVRVRFTDSDNDSGTASVTVMVSNVAPSVTISTPTANQVFLLNGSVPLGAQCTDPGTLDTWTASVNWGDGSPLENLGSVSCNTGIDFTVSHIYTTVGSKTIVVTVRDDDTGSDQASVIVKIQYQFIGFLPPIDNPPMVNIVKAGRTIPTKWQLQDAGGNYISDLSSFQSLLSAPIACDASPGAIVEETVDATGGTVLRYDAIANQFIYNWQTMSGWKGTCRLLQLTLNDGTQHWAKFNFTK